ncbi:MAG: class I SAM-dependent methyltransferase [Hyphomicrobiaceae bacterium]
MTADAIPQDVVTGPKWDRNYAGPDYIFGTEPNAFLASQANRFAKHGRILVPGDGEGRNGVWLSGQGFGVVSVEASAVGVGKACALAVSRGVQPDIQHCNLEAWAWPISAFDGAASIFVHLMPHVRRALHRRILNALKPGGILILEAFTPKHVEKRGAGSRGGPPPEMLYTEAMLRDDFTGATFEFIEEANVVLDEGSRHTGRASVVRLVLRRAQ